MVRWAQVDCNQRVAAAAPVVHLGGAALSAGHPAAQQVPQSGHAGHTVQGQL